jgi:Icc-related predicted phosphoesterase
MSDLHLEFENPFLPPEMEGDADTVLVLAGDIHNKTKAVPWIQALAPRFRHVLYVLGNHDFWGGHLQLLPDEIKGLLAETPNVSLLHNDAIEIGGALFMGGTLWTDFDKENEQSLRKAPEYMIPDYREIRTGGYQRIKPHHILDEHYKTRAFFDGKFQENFAGPKVVISHHGPSPSSIHRKFYYAQGNEYYVSDLEELMYLYQPTYWLHGHTHESMDYIIDQTRVVVNPFGYHGYQTNENFKPDLRLEI